MQLFMAPFIMLFLFSFAVTMEVKNVSLAILNQDNGDFGIRYAALFTSGSTFPVHKSFRLQSSDEIERVIAQQEAFMVLCIPENFSEAIISSKPVSVQIIFDGRKSNSAQIAFGYSREITGRFAAELQKNNLSAGSNLNIEARQLYNPNHNYLWFTLPVLMVMLTQMLAILVSGLSIARERELGTFDQLLVSPLSSMEIVIGKAVPAVCVAFMVGIAVHFLARTVFGVPCFGSLALLALGFLLFILAVTGVGLFISSLCNTQQQAFLAVFTCMVPFVLLSGFAAPIDNMPDFLKPVTLINPCRHVINIALGVYLKAAPIENMLSDILWLSGISAATLTFSAWYFKKKIQ